MQYLELWYNGTAFTSLSYGNVVMWGIAFILMYLGIKKGFEPLLLVPIAFGILIANIPAIKTMIFKPPTADEAGGIMYYLQIGLYKEIYPPLIFLGVGALTDFSPMLSNPKTILLGGAAQFGIFATLWMALGLGFNKFEATAIGIIGSADGPTSIYVASKAAKDLLGVIAISAYSYMAMVPIIQPPVMKLLTTSKERKIKMKNLRKVSKLEKLIFPIVVTILAALVAPQSLSLIGMLMLGNLLRETKVTDRLAKAAGNTILDSVTIILGITVGATTTAGRFLNPSSLYIFFLGSLAFSIATAAGVIFAKIMNIFSKNKVNPLIGAAGVSAVPNSARVVQTVASKEDPENFLLMHAMGPNVAGVIGSAIAAGVLLSLLKL
jgi:sodium ion-translocating decarboxylase beta subunit